MVGPWEALAAELALWRDAGLVADFWWRDDDAGAPSASLRRLMQLAEARQVPLALAVIPGAATPDVIRGAGREVRIIQHGVDHQSRSVAGQKKNEFPDSEPVDVALERLSEGRARLQEVAGEWLLPVLAPPWNRISQKLVDRLPQAGIRGLSRFGVRNITNSPAVSLIQANTHVDIIDWQGDRGFCGAERALAQAIRHLAARRAGTADPAEPTGWLTHHAVHDEECWRFLEQLFDATQVIDNVRWYSADVVFRLPGHGARSG